MRNTKFHEGDKVSLTVPADTPSGTAVLVGSLVGVTATAEGKGGNVDGKASVWRKGAFKLPISTTTAIAEGGPVYITSGGVLTPVSTSNTLFGYVLEAKPTSVVTAHPVVLAKV